MWKPLFALAVSAAVISTSVYSYRHREEMFRPDVQKLGGTRVTFAIESGTPDDDYLTAMRRRFDPRGRLGVVVRHAGGEVEILVPRGPAHEETVARVERLAGRPGEFFFLPIAESASDDGVAKYVEATHAKGGTPLTATPPPPKNTLGGGEFPVSTAGHLPRRYRWVRLGESAAMAFRLDPASLAVGNAAERPSVERAARAGSVLHPLGQPEATILVARMPGEAELAFFLLVRDESDHDAVAASHVRRAEGDDGAHGPSSIRLRLDHEGWVRLMAMQQQEHATRSAPRTSPSGSGSSRFHSLAIVIDDRVASLPVFAMSQRPEVILEVGSGGEERDDLVSLLREAPRGVRLSVRPTRVEALEPKK